MSSPIIFWFRQDLRIKDNAALTAAASTGRPIICIYILDTSQINHWPFGQASLWWLHHSLTHLTKALKSFNVKLILRSGSVIEELDNIVQSTDAQALYFTKHYEPYNNTVEDKVHEHFLDRLEIKRYRGYLLFEPEEIRTGKNEPYKVFTPFYRNCLKTNVPGKPIPAPKTLTIYKKKIDSEKLTDWNLLPNKPNWAKGFNDYWTPGETSAHEYLKDFIAHAGNKYPMLRNRPDINGTSRLSPHLHFGEISPKQIWAAIKNSSKILENNGEAYLRQLIWRDFAYHLLVHWPDFPEKPFREEFSKFPWKNDAQSFKAWQKGQTGFPIVDAGMRELWKTGWMHNRVRMIVASFLIKDLLIPWQQGQQWFWNTLVDANLANNAASWQWVAGSGADASPYFRIFNPVLQGEKFDPLGDYVREWVPELRHMPKKYIHSPWLAPENILNTAKVTLGDNYPHRIIDHSVARDRALAAYKKLKR
ncbi:MAG: deoxyribodipyrimidine photo-lyase [Gammaproteobacteria bacterium]